MKKKRNYLSINSSIVLENNHVDILHDACKICWNQKSEDSIEKKINYIGKRIKIGHESILEHSNIVLYIELSKSLSDDLLEILPECKYLEVKIKQTEKIIYLLLGGSIRGYKQIFRNIKNMNNRILAEILNNMYLSVPKEYFIDFIDAGIANELLFNKVFSSESYHDSYLSKVEINTDKIEIINMDDIECLYNKIGDIFSYDDLLDVCTITILFKDMSRTATHQLVRHRNAITQESQRYVDYSTAKFTSPESFKDKYKDKTYDITINDQKLNMSMSDLGNLISSIYPQLRTQNVDKEDARAFLPSNIQCNKLYMTFTFKKLIKFLELRTDNTAQAEIKEYAIDIENVFKYKISPIIGDIYKYLLPKYILVENDYSYDGIDEIVSEMEEEV